MGAAWAAEARGRRVAIWAIEHHAGHGAAEVLERLGYTATHLPVGREGLVDPAAIATLPADTTVVAVMLANNETGVIQPIAAVAAAASARGMRLMCGGGPAAGKIPVPPAAPGGGGPGISGPKFGGPQGGRAPLL